MAGLGKKTFTAGDVLIAGDVNSYLMDQTVMNFATTAARSSAIPVPSTGMVSYVGDTGSDSATNATIANVPQIQAYTGAAWQNVDGLTLVAKATIGTTVSSVVMNNVFSADYDNYKIIISGGVSSTANNMSFTLGATATGYYEARINCTYATGAISANTTNNGASGTIGQQTAQGLFGNLDILGPFLATQTNWGSTQLSATTSRADQVQGMLNNTTSYTAFTITTGAGTLTGGTIYVYGYRKS
jgi:hypothetical protein